MQTASDLKATIEAFKLQGIKTVRDIATALNASKIATPQGKQWHSTSVYRLLKRIDTPL
ncbi:recombinase family protein [Prosthecobacter algae]